MSRAGIPSDPYSFRLWAGNRWGASDESELKAKLDEWITHTAGLMNSQGQPLAANRSDATRLILLDLIRYRLGVAAPQPVQQAAGSVPDLEQFAAELEQTILEKVRGLLAGIAVNPDKLGQLAAIGEQYDKADDIPDDMFGNILDDFRNTSGGYEYGSQ